MSESITYTITGTEFSPGATEAYLETISAPDNIAQGLPAVPVGPGGTFTFMGTTNIGYPLIGYYIFDNAPQPPGNNGDYDYVPVNGYAYDDTGLSATAVTLITPLVAPTITGTVAGQTSTLESPTAVFSGVTIGDTNDSGADTDTLSITYTGPGTLADGAGFSGLTGSAGSYTLTGTAAAITAELDALVFTPVDGVPNTSVTTTFTLSDTSGGFPTATTDSTTSITDSDPATINRTWIFNGEGVWSDGADWSLSGVPGGSAYPGTASLTSSLTGPYTVTLNTNEPSGSGAITGLTVANANATLALSTPGTMLTIAGTGAEAITETAGTINISNTATLDLAGGNSTFLLSDNGTFDESAGSLEIAGTTATALDLVGGLFNQAGGSVTIAGGANVESGDLAVNGGSLSAGSLTVSGGFTESVGATVNVTGLADFDCDPGQPAVIASFLGSNGTYPLSGLIADANGDLFGTTAGGGGGGQGLGSGTVFEIVNSNGTLASTPTTLVTFNGNDGATPYGSLIADANGDLFGTT